MCRCTTGPVRGRQPGRRAGMGGDVDQVVPSRARLGRLDPCKLIDNLHAGTARCGARVTTARCGARVTPRVVTEDWRLSNFPVYLPCFSTCNDPSRISCNQYASRATKSPIPATVAPESKRRARGYPVQFTVY